MAVAASFCGPNAQWLDNNGAPLAAGRIYFYDAGTTTPEDTWTTPAFTPGSENTNPVVLDSSGRSATAIYLETSTAYKVVLKDSNLVTIWTRDNYAVAPAIP